MAKISSFLSLKVEPVIKGVCFSAKAIDKLAYPLLQLTNEKRIKIREPKKSTNKMNGNDEKKRFIFYLIYVIDH